MVPADVMKCGKKKSCGCLPVGAQRRDLTGQRFGRLTVLSHSHATPNGQQFWFCRCDCGTNVVRPAGYLPRVCKSGEQSCGCSMREETIKRNTKHGHYRDLTYSSWCAMKRRCSSPKHPAYSEYGGRGIKVCDRWRDSFEAFLADMGERPSKRHSIDRVNVNGDYEPSNCRWTTMREQARNSRRTKLSPAVVRLIRESTAAGMQQKTIASLLGVGVSTVSQVVNRKSWGDIE